MSNDLDYQVLLQIIPVLSEDMIVQIESALANNLAGYMRFREIKEIVKEKRRQTLSDTERVKSGWLQYTKSSRSRFDVLIEKYLDRYKKNAKEKGRKGTVLALNSELSGHNKWYRMLSDHGIGPQYHDDIRRLCFIFELSYSESIEFLWSAGQPLDNESMRDYVIADCLVNKIYARDKVNDCLAALKQKELFQYD